MANELAIQQRQIIAQYHFTEIFAVFNDGLSKSMMAAMADGITSTGDLLPYVWTDYLIVLVTNLCRTLMIETTMMLANLATKPEAKQTLQREYFQSLLGRQ